MDGRFWIVAGALLAAVGVGAGSFGAHGLEQWLADQAAADSDASAFVAKRIDQFETGVRYHLVHALALILAGLLHARTASKALAAAGVCFLAGVILFSGMLYALVLTDTPRLGMIVPIGGAAYIVGWALLAVAGWGMKSAPDV
jgi:uncharacterized membrane protein YgdD (TMEM256/DUF423 family)